MFTALKKTAIFKDVPALRCELLKPSSKTAIVPIRSDEWMPPPPLRTVESARSGKRRRIVESPTDNAAAAAEPPSSSRLVPPRAAERCGGGGCREVPLYTGTVTAVVHSQGMLYELDGVVLLLCSHWQTVSRARELRPGNRVRVYNVHALPGPAPGWPSAANGRERHAGVLACCARSTVDVVTYGPLDRPAVIANWSDPVLNKFSKQLTLARFLDFLPVCDAMADKFGNVNPAGKTLWLMPLQLSLLSSRFMLSTLPFISHTAILSCAFSLKANSPKQCDSLACRHR